MADQKISQLTSLTGANTASGDLVTIVDISDTTMGASGTNKKMTLTEFQASPVSAGTANGVVYLNGSKVATAGSALTFDGTNLGVGTTSPLQQLHLSSASATGLQITFQGTGATRIGVAAGNALTFGLDTSNGTTERMRLDASGNLGIGTSSPGSRLDVSGEARATVADGITAARWIAGTGRVRLRPYVDATLGAVIDSSNTAESAYLPLSFAGSTLRLGADTTQTFVTAGVDRMRLDASGNLGIGTTSPTTKLHVSSTATEVIFQDSDTAKASSLTAFLGFYGSDGRAGYVGYPADSSLYITNQNSAPILFLTNNTERMRLDASGNLGLNAATFGTSAVGVLSLGTGTAPTTGPADTVQLFSVDRSAGNTIPAVRCEGSGVTNAGITNTTVTNKIAIQVNGTIYYLLATTNAT